MKAGHKVMSGCVSFQVSGGKDGLDALQTAGVISGLPYTVVICLLCVATWRCVKVAWGDLGKMA